MSGPTPNPILQAAAIPYRMENGSPRFCLITSTSKGNWGFPKGIIDPGETAEETALKESAEEAGLGGKIVGGPLGGFIYHKWGTSLEVIVFLMQVSAVANHWDEMELRNRTWCSESETRNALGRNEYLPLLDAALKRISG